MTKSTQIKYKIAGLVVLFIPAAILLVFAVGESVSGDFSGLFHIVQVIPFVLLAILGWKHPRLGGWSMLAFAGLFLIIILNDLEPALVIGVALIACSGLLFLISSRYKETGL